VFREFRRHEKNSRTAYLAIFLRFLKPFLAPPDGSSAFEVTRSILDIIFIQGISRFTIADIADNTPLERKG
jgi:hypothetical protein